MFGNVRLLIVGGVELKSMCVVVGVFCFCLFIVDSVM